VTVRQRWPLVLLGVMMAAYVAYFGWFTLRAHDVFLTRAFDLGIYDQAVWNTLDGQWFRSTIEEGWDVLLADHFQPILLPIALLYSAWQSPKMLLLIQTIGLALGALPVYWLARDGLQSLLAGISDSDGEAAGVGSSVPGALIELSALAFAAVYLLLPALHSANLDEFHPGTLAAPLLLYALHFMRQRRSALFFLFTFLALTTKEVIPLTTVLVGLYVILIRRERGMGLAVSVMSILWFVLAFVIVIPHFSPYGQSPYLAPSELGEEALTYSSFYSSLGDNAGEIVVRLITQPSLLLERVASRTGLAYINALLSPLAYVPLLGLPVLLLATPTLLMNLLSDYAIQQRITHFFHYAVLMVPFLMVAALDGATFLARRLHRPLGKLLPAERRPEMLAAAIFAGLSGLILVSTLFTQWRHGFLPFSRDFYLVDRSRRMDAAESIVEQVPQVGVVSADHTLVPHLSQRESIYVYPSLHSADFVAADVTYRNGPFNPRDHHDSIQKLLVESRYGVLDGRHGYLLLERGLEQPVIPDPFYDFARAQDALPQVELQVDFGQDLRLVGYDLVWERPVTSRAYLTMYWQVLRPVDGDLRLFFIQTDPAGDPQPGTELEFAESVWYPPSRWTPGDVVRTETLHWSMEDPVDFGLALGVVEGPGFWELDKRLKPSASALPGTLPLVHGDTLLWLGTLSTDGQSVTLEPPGGRGQ
jgi:uncharacterized membrane protein